jgi:TetR/AcrR family transcriptional regulator, regulator of cefoperazone and chloramphenicol sensitivity
MARPSSKPPSDQDGDTRQRVIEAAIQCILENGFYRASSNAIAERAGLSWGVIQYWFGSRESLMVAVMEDGTKRLHRLLVERHVTGATATERVESYFDILADYYGQPAWLAFMQVALNLTHDPATSQRTIEMLREMNASASPLFARLDGELFGDCRGPDPGVPEFVFHAVRGVAMSELMLSIYHPDSGPDWKPDLAGSRRLLGRAVGHLVEED